MKLFTECILTTLGASHISGCYYSLYVEAEHNIGLPVRILAARKKIEKMAVLILGLITGPERI
jgi:hypothetical protein